MQHHNEIIDMMEETYSSQEEHTTSRSILTIDIVSKVETFSSLMQEWTTLAESSTATVFQTHEWLFLWWKHLGAGNGRLLRILLFRYEGNLVGIAPLFQQTSSFSGIRFNQRVCLMGSGSAFGVSSGMFLDDGPSDYLDFIVRPGFEEEINSAFIKHIVEYADIYKTIEFVNLKPKGFIYSSLLPLLIKHGMSCKISQADICPYIAVPSSVENYFKQLSPGVRRRLQQARNAAAEKTLFATSQPDTREKYHQALDELIRLHQQRWNTIGYPGLFSDERFKHFQHDVIDAFLEKGRVWCKMAAANGKCVAGRIAFKFNNTYFDYLSGFDDHSPAAKRRPGLALVIEMLEDAVHGHYVALDLLRGDEQYKFDFTSESNYNWNLLITSGKKSTLIARLAAAGELLLFLLKREARLLRVQRNHHGVLLCIVYYIKFRTPLFTRKLTTLLNKKSPAAGLSAERE
jgi:CelD/BcsL family acetyltransferase involved in cellulose biosynthesis